MALDLSDDAKKKLLKGLADLISVPAELMFIVSVKDAKRRLLSVDLTVGVLANSDASAQQVKSDILKADLSSLLYDLGLQGLVSGFGKTDVIILTPSKGTPAPAPEPEKNPNTGVIVGSVVGAICLFCVTSSVAYYFLSLRSARKNLAEKLGSEGEMVVTPPSERIEPEEEELSVQAGLNRDINLMKDYSEVMRILDRTSYPTSLIGFSLRPSTTVIRPLSQAVGPREVELR